MNRVNNSLWSIMLLSCIYGRFRLITWPVIGSDLNTFWPTLRVYYNIIVFVTSLYDFLTASAWDLFSSSTTLTPLDSKCVLIALSSVLLSRLKTKVSFILGPAFRVVGSFVPNMMLLFLLSLFRSRRIWFAGRWKSSPWSFSVIWLAAKLNQWKLPQKYYNHVDGTMIVNY